MIERREPKMPILIQTTISPTPWREQYDRMRQWRQRMATSADTDLVDYTHAFFITCFHLRDWLKADTSIPASIGTAASELVNSDPSLRVCADLANGLKHLVLTQRTRTGVPVLLTTELPPTVHDARGASLGDAMVIADRCITAWDAFLKTHGLL